MTPYQRELIGRAATLLLAAILLAGAYGLASAGAWMLAEERREDVQRPTPPGSMQRKTRVSGLFWAGAIVLGIVGGGVAIVALLPNRIIYRIHPKAPVLWDNPEPNYLHRHF